MSLRINLIFALYFFNLLSASAQTIEQESKIRLSIITPENIDNLDYSQLSRLNSKFNEIITQSGFSGDGINSSSFIVYPKILVNEFREADAGMFRVFSVSIDVAIVVMEYSSKIIFQSLTFELKGSGDSKKNAIDNAIRTMKTSSVELSQFFKASRSKIVNYYINNCDDILRKGDLFLLQKKFVDAFAMYLSIPSEVDCSKKTIPLLITAFKSYQNSNCSELLQNAKASFGSRDFNRALMYLSKIDPESICSAESNKLINECFKYVSESESRNFEFLKEVYKTEKSLENKRIEAARDIVVEYYKSRPAYINYNTLVIY